MAQRPLAAVYIDTNVVATDVTPAIAHHRACAGFCALLERTRTKVFFSEILRLEFAHLWFRLPSTPYVDAETVRAFRLRAWDRDADVREQWMNEGVRTLEAFLGRFDEVFELPFNRSIWRASLPLMARHRLRSNDAAHVATALSVGVLDFATVDADFRRVPNLRLHLLRDAPSMVEPEP